MSDLPTPAPSESCPRCSFLAATEKHRGGHALTDERRALFLEALSDTGSVVAASAAATPWAQGRQGGAATFYDERHRDPAFAQQWDRALEAALAKVESEIMRRAFTPETRPVFSRGELVGEQRTFDNRLLVTLARRLNPDAWSERSKVEHEGKVDHAHRHTVDVRALAGIFPEDVQLLPEAMRSVFINALAIIVQAREAEQNALPATKQLASGTGGQ